MRRSEAIFLSLVCAFAVVFVTMTLFALPHSGGAGGASVRAGGQARDVDMPKLERLMREQYLSNREAEFYHPVESNKASLNPLAPMPPENAPTIKPP